MTHGVTIGVNKQDAKCGRRNGVDQLAGLDFDVFEEKEGAQSGEHGQQFVGVGNKVVYNASVDFRVKPGADDDRRKTHKHTNSGGNPPKRGFLVKLFGIQPDIRCNKIQDNVPGNIVHSYIDDGDAAQQDINKRT